MPESTIKYICVRTASSLILGPESLRDLRGTGAPHLAGEAIRAAETAQMQSSRISDGGLGASHMDSPAVLCQNTAAMRIEDLRHTGKMLLQEISSLTHSPERKTVLGTGAAGDKFFPVDRRAEEIILSGLTELGEPLTIISEESGIIDMHGGGTRVIIDPVDGSKNAISGIPLFSTSIAVADGDTIGDIKLSYVINLITGDEFWAEKCSGAFLNGGRIHTQDGEEFYLVLYEAQSPARDIDRIMPLLSKSRKTRCLGSTALDMAYLSLGAAGVFVSPSPSRSFDFAGGWLLIKEAGGVVTNTEGENIINVPLGLERSSTLLASANQRLHEKAVKLLSKRKENV